MAPRSTPDLVALILAGVVAIVTCATAGALLYISIVHPEQDMSATADAVGRIIGVMVAALVGYMAGRRITNGH